MSNWTTINIDRSSYGDCPYMAVMQVPIYGSDHSPARSRVSLLWKPLAQLHNASHGQDS